MLRLINAVCFQFPESQREHYAGIRRHRGQVIFTNKKKKELKLSRLKCCTKDTKLNLDVRAGLPRSALCKAARRLLNNIGSDGSRRYGGPGFIEAPSETLLSDEGSAAALDQPTEEGALPTWAWGQGEVRLLSALRLLLDPRKKPESGLEI